MDTRFSRLSTDPRFIKPKKQDKKVKIDERFTEMFSRDFNQESNLVDKRGKPIVSDESEKMARFYYNDSDDTKEDDEDQLTVGAKLARGITTLESSDEDEQEEIEVQEDSSTQEEILLGPETNRLALVNLDWDHISAKDIFKLFSSFSPDQITSTTIYISDFGKAQMEIESKSGPPSSIFNKSDKLIQSDSGSEFDQEELRKYQLSRLKYYYCVIECKTIEAAKKIYIECDDTEFESSSNLIDLRYIPNETVFSNQVFDFAENLDSEYTPKDFSTRALQHTRVALTWDNDDQDRIKITRRKFTQDELKDMDFKAFIASDEDSDVDVDKYRNLLSIEDNEQDMEITFTPGLTKSLETAISKKQEGIIEESVFDRERRERKEKKKAKKVVENDALISDSEHEESNQFDDDFFASDKQTSKPKKQVKKKNASEPESLEKTKSRAQLQLLLLDDDNKQTDLDFNAKEILKSQKPSHRKKKNVCEGLQESFEIDLKDERFRDIYKHDFFIDTTNPKFKKTENMEKIRRAVRDSNVVDGDVAGIVDGRRELDVLVESAKRKSMLALKEKSKKVKII